MVLIEKYTFPDDLYYHKDHAWAKIESNGNIRSGVNDFYQQSAGDITNIDIPFEGDEVTQGETCARIQSAKWIGKFVSPVSGEIIKTNIELELNSSLINQSPYKKGWIILIKPSNLDDDLKNLLQGTAVVLWLKKEIVDAEKKKKK
jgi:glycine cleavage system H protein